MIRNITYSPSTWSGIGYPEGRLGDRMGTRFLIAVGALVAGTAIGAWQARGERLELRGQVISLEKETRACKRGAASQGIARILGGRDGAVDAAAGRPEPAFREPTPDAPTDAPQPEEAPDREPQIPETTEAMADALDARSAQAHAALIEQADPDDEQLAKIDAAIDKMNARLKSQVDAFAVSVDGGTEPDRRELMDFAAEALDAVIEADDSFREALPENIRDAIDDKAIDPFSYIDGSTLASLAQLEGGGE